MARHHQHLKDRAQLRPAISLSVQCAKAEPACEHGLDRLGQSLGVLARQALAYKPAKWQAQGYGLLTLQHPKEELRHEGHSSPLLRHLFHRFAIILFRAPIIRRW